MRVRFTASIDVPDSRASELAEMAAEGLSLSDALSQLVQNEIGHTGALVIRAEEA